jgi:hypothetical protein
MGLSLKELAVKYAAGTLTDAELKESGYWIHQVEGQIESILGNPTNAKVWKSLKDGIREIHRASVHVHRRGDSEISLNINFKNLREVNAWGDRIMCDTSREGWEENLEHLADLISGNIKQQTGVSVDCHYGENLSAGIDLSWKS